MIHGLGPLASGTPPDAAPPPAPADDPAVFAAALVAALGLQQPIQVTVTPAQPVAEGAELVEDDEQAAEGEEVPLASAPVESEAEAGAPVVARVTPDPEVLEESETFDRIPVARAPQPRATPAPAPETKESGDTTLVPGKTSITGDRPVAETAAKAPRVPVTDQVPALSVRPTTPAPVAERELAPAADAAAVVARVPAPVSAPSVDASGVTRKESKEVVAASDDAAPADASVPVVATPVVQPGVVLPEIARSPLPAAAAEREVVAHDEAMSRAPVAGTMGEPLSSPYGGKVPPQSVQERTARAMAENVRVGRQLAELLGDDAITEFKLELGRHPSANPGGTAAEDTEESAPAPFLSAPPAKHAEAVTGSLLPREALAPKSPRKAAQGTLAREAIEPIIARPLSREPVTITPMTSRPEIVRMVANASLAASPNLAQTEGTPAAGKAPAPSVTPSLPGVRQELPGARSHGEGRAVDEPERFTIRESGTSADAPPSSLVPVNNQAANKPADAPENGRATREARNLPSHESTEQQAAGSADRVTLQVADDEGRQTRIRVSVTGNQIRAVITPPDGSSARQLEQRMDQLHETLVRQGFTDPKVIVRTAPETANDAAAVAGATSGNQERNTVPAGRDQPAGDQRQGRGQREQDRGDGHRHPQGHSRERDPRDRRR